MTQKPTSPISQIVLITGPSGAGRSTAIRAFEDMNYETIDNMPLSLMSHFFREAPPERHLAFGMDTRTRDFSVAGVLEIYEMIEAQENTAVSLIYIDCATEVLLRRFSETRRRHPMSPDETPKKGIEDEKDLLSILKSRADVLINTNELSPHDLRAEIAAQFGGEGADFLAVNLQSFSYKRGVPRGVDMVLDCRFLKNPYWDESLRGKTGLDDAVKAYVQADERYAAFFDQTVNMARLLLPAYKQEGKAHFTIGLGCTGGQHRSVCVTEELSRALSQNGWQVAVRHRELERKAHRVL